MLTLRKQLMQIIFDGKPSLITYNTFCTVVNAKENDDESTISKKKALREKARQKIAQIEAEQSQSPNTPYGMMNRSPHVDPNIPTNILARAPNPAFDPFPDNKNPKTGEVNGPTGPEPTRYGDWENRGRCSDF